jgi:DNA-binding NtrC family response regulator/tetratricopeptide (TPR) repeat protein
MPGRVEMLGQSPAVVAIRERLATLLRHQSGTRRPPPILLSGETGTGKGLLARLIHESGPRASAPFVHVNCPAIPESLLEAELFGFERGAFTDARQAKAGLFQAADGGILFLDEIGLLPESLQAKLLTALEERSVRRLGSTRSERVDVWIVAATSEDLPAAVKGRRFREDLYYRLAVVEIHLPPLRDRAADVLVLGSQLLDRTCAEYGLERKTLAADAQGAMLRYPWPGNVRELANVIERAALLSDASVVTAGILALPRLELETPAPVDTDATPHSYKAALRQQDEQRLTRALHQAGWNISRAAELLGIPRSNLRYRIAKYKLRPDGLETGTIPHAPAVARIAPSPATVPTWQRRYLALLYVAPGASPREVPGEPFVDEVVTEKIETFGGYVIQESPSSLIAAFGVPPGEDSAIRAVAAARTVQQALRKPREKERETGRIRLAIHSGTFLVRVSGSAVVVDMDVLHEARTLFDRITRDLDGSNISVTSAVAPLLERRFQLVALGGDTPPIGYRLLGPESTGYGLAGRPLSPYVGRHREHAILEDVRTQAETGHGQFVAVVGEPGLGKSRLVYEFCQGLHAQGWQTLEGHASSTGQLVAFWPVTDLLRRHFRIEDDTSPAGVRERVGRHLAASAEAEEMAPALLEVLDAPPTEGQWVTLAPAERRRRTLSALRRFLVWESARRPLVLAIEDLHWIDSQTQAFIDMLAQTLPAAPMIVLVSYRPEYEHAAATRTAWNRIRLHPLSVPSADALLTALVGKDQSLAPVKRLLIDRSGGNPFFLEEAVCDLLESRHLVGQRGECRLTTMIAHPEVPATVGAVLGARIERLSTTQQHILEIAAVVGNEVSASLVGAIAGMDQATLRRELIQLVGSEFLYETAASPEVAYRFKHALTHDVAYRRLSGDRKRTLHAGALRALEEESPRDSIVHVESLAHHAFHAGEWSKALLYCRRAGQRANRRLAHTEAVSYLEHAVSAADHLPEDRAAVEQSIDLRIDLRAGLFPLSEYDRVREHLARGAVLAKAIRDDVRLARIIATQAHYFCVITGELREATRCVDELASIASVTQDPELASVAGDALGRNYFSFGRYRECADTMKTTVTAIDRSRSDYPGVLLMPVASAARVWMAWALAELGDFDEGTAVAQEAVRRAEARAQPWASFHGYWALAVLCLGRGEHEAALQPLAQMRRIVGETDALTLPRITDALIGHGHALGGRPAEAVSHLEKSFAIQAPHHAFLVCQDTNYLADAYRRCGRLDEAFSMATRALEVAQRLEHLGREAYALKTLGDVSAALGAHRDADERYQQALAVAERCQMKPLVAHCHSGLAEGHRRAGRHEPARHHFTLAQSMYEAMGMRLWLAPGSGAGL